MLVPYERQRWVCRHLPSLRRLLAAGGRGGACMSMIITVRLPCTLQLSIRVWVGLVMLAEAGADLSASDHRQGSPCGSMPGYYALTFPHVDLSATNCKGQTAEDSALLGVLAISRPQKLVGPRSVRCGRFACAAALLPFNLLQAPHQCHHPPQVPNPLSLRP